MATAVIDPQEDLNFTIDFSGAIGADTIATSSWAVTPSGPTLDNATDTDTTATTYMSGATAGVIYILTCTVTTTTAASTIQKSITVRAENI